MNDKSLQTNSDRELESSSIKKSSHIFFIYLFTLIYVLITALSITQVQLLLNDKVNLPIIGVGVNITFFIIVSPFILVALFVIYNLHYLHLKKSGKHNVESFYYWPIFEFGKFNSNEGKDYGLNFPQSITSNFIIWGLLPLTLFVICFIYLPSHEWFWTLWLIVCSSFGNFIVGYFWVKNDDDNNRTDNRKKIIKSALKTCFTLSAIFYIVIILLYDNLLETLDALINLNKDTLLIILALIVILFVSIITTLWVYFKFKVLRVNKSLLQFLKRLLYNVWIIVLLSPFINVHYTFNTGCGKNRNLDVSYQIISQSFNLPHRGIYSVNLRGKDLRYADLIASVLSKSDMRKADLRGAGLNSASLDSSNLEGANLQGAKLPEAILNYATLDNVNLSNADLKGVVFGFTKLRKANLNHSDLRKAKLRSAILDSADLSYVDLRGAELDYTRLGNLKTLYNAKLDFNVLEDIRNHFDYLLEKK